ncbi:MAG: PD40 domain-containing protein [Bryobacterales bacterium]|nr:PD40 domain-containing protein [Bryobacterales bacterium]
MQCRIAAIAVFAACGVVSAEVSFEREVKPVLQKHCAGCHQPGSKASGLDLTTYDGFRAGGKRGTAFNVNAPAESIVIKYMTGELKPSMPLGGTLLPTADVDRIRLWIQEGAKNDSRPEEVSTGPIAYKQPPVITALKFSPDGKTLAVSGNREVLLHNADGSGVTKRLQGKAERILSIAYSPDGSLLLAGGGTPARFGELQFWDPRSGKLLRTAEATNDTVFGASLSPDGKKAAAGAADNSVYVFDTSTAKQLYKVTSHENWVLATVFGVNSKRFVSVGRDRAAKLVDAEAGQFLENVNQMRGELAAVARHPNKDVIVVGGEDRIPYVYMMDRPRNLKVGEELTLIRKLDAQNGPIFALEWSPDGSRIAVAGAASAVNIYDAESGSKVAACSGHTAGIYALSFSPDGQRLATGGFDGKVRFYRTSDCSLEKAMVPVPIEGGAPAGGMR